MAMLPWNCSSSEKWIPPERTCAPALAGGPYCATAGTATPIANTKTAENVVLSFISNRLCGFRPRREGCFLIISGRTIVRPTWQSSGNFLHVRPGGAGFAQVAGGSAFGASSTVNILCYYCSNATDAVA